MLILEPVPGGGVSMAPIVAVLEGILEKIEELEAPKATPVRAASAAKRKPRVAKSRTSVG